MTTSAPGTAGTPSHAMPKRLWRASPPLVLALYLLLALLFFGSSGSWTTRHIGMGSDPIQFIWFLNWWPFALRHGLDPFWTQYVWYPEGFDLAWATSVPVLSLLAAPLTLTMGATFTFNILSVLSPTLSAWTAYLLGRDIARDDIAAFFAGYFFGFSSYELGQLEGHLNLSAIYIIPLLVLLVIRRFRGTLSRPPFIVLTAILLFIQLGISKEIVATLCAMGAIVWLVFRWFGDPEDRPGLWRLAFDAIVALCGLAILALPYVFYLVRGASATTGIIHSPWWYSADLLNYVLPTAITAFSSNTLTGSVVSHFTGGLSENGAYLGLPLIAILTAATWQFRRTPRIRALATATGVLAVLSLGPVLHIAGRMIFIPLPWAALLNAPLIRNALPARITMYVSLASGLLVASWIGSGQGRDRAFRVASALAAGVFLLPNPLTFAWSALPEMPPALKQPELSARLGPHPKVLVLPFSYLGPGMAWQLEAKMAFIQCSGYVGFVPKQALDWAAVHDFGNQTPSRHFANAVSAFCVTHHVTAIAMAPDTSPKLVDALLSLGWKTEKLKEVTLVHVPPVGALNYFTVIGDHWPSEREFSWIGRKATIHAGRDPLAVLISGQDRPAKLPPVTLTVAIEGKRQNERVDRSSRISITIPAGQTATFHADKTFPSVSKNHDRATRHLSVEIAITPKRSDAAPSSGPTSR